MQTAANYHIYMEMEGARMIQKEKIRSTGYFLMALAAHRITLRGRVLRTEFDGDGGHY